MTEQKTQNNATEPTEPSSRRSFLSIFWVGLGIVAFIEFIGVVGAFLLPRKKRGKTGNFGTIIEAGPVEKFPKESVTAFIRGKFYLARLKDGGFLALSRKCTHLGCTVPWVSEEEKFVCPCHSSAFDIRGEVANPPAPRALDIYRVFVENDIIKVDTGKKIKRTEFRPEQVTYPKAS
jgi:cytochrome b6-f complex iron-sulfur subunit